MTHLQQDWRGLVVDGAALVVCVSAMVVELVVSDKSDVTVWAVAAIVATALPVLARRRRPAAACALAVALIFGVLLTSEIYQTVALPAILCGYSLASRHGRRAAIVGALLITPVVLLMLWQFSPHDLSSWDTAKNLAFVALPMALGVAAHERRAYTTALLARAEDAERSREEETLRRVGEERLRIARDVHDLVAHAMVAINVQAGVGAHLLDRDLDQARETLRNIKTVSGEALSDLRTTLGVLRESDDPGVTAPTRPTQGLEEIADLGAGLRAAGVDLDLDIDDSAVLLPASLGTTGYRIVQEALTNVMRHAGPTSARVCIARVGDRLVIEVEDDGAGLATPLGVIGSGNGLRGMRERASAVGGSLDVGPRVGGGWRVSASLPVAVS